MQKIQSEDACINDLLKSLAYDETHDLEVAWIVQSIGGVVGKDAIRDATLNLVVEMRRQGLLEIGKKAYKGLSPLVRLEGTETMLLERLRADWDAVEPPHVFGEVFWVEATEKGLERERLLRLH